MHGDDEDIEKMLREGEVVSMEDMPDKAATGMAVCESCKRKFKAGVRSDVCIDCLVEEGGAN